MYGWKALWLFVEFKLESAEGGTRGLDSDGVRFSRLGTGWLHNQARPQATGDDIEKDSCHRLYYEGSSAYSKGDHLLRNFNHVDRQADVFFGVVTTWHVISSPSSRLPGLIAKQHHNALQLKHCRIGPKRSRAMSLRITTWNGAHSFRLVSFETC